MSIYVCDECGRLENTALAMYWVKGHNEPALCSACDPKVATISPVRADDLLYDPTLHKVLNRG